MLDLTRRRFLAALAVSLAGLAMRRAAARPARVRIEPVLSKLPPAEPAPAPVEVSMDGWFPGPGNWAYSPRLGWIHTFQPMPDRKLAAWYGPPPPFPAREPINWGPLPTKEIKALIAGPLPLRGIHR